MTPFFAATDSLTQIEANLLLKLIIAAGIVVVLIAWMSFRYKRYILKLDHEQNAREHEHKMAQIYRKEFLNG